MTSWINQKCDPRDTLIFLGLTAVMRHNMFLVYEGVALIFFKYVFI